MAVKTIHIDDEVGSVRLYKRKGQRTMRLSIKHDGSLSVTMPMWVPQYAAVTFVKERKTWIQQQLPPEVIFQNGQQVGKSHLLRISQKAGLEQVKIRVSSDAIVASTPLGLPFDDPELQLKLRQAAEKALRQQAEELLPERLHQLAQLHGFSFNSVRIRRLTSRWGSCSSRGDIVLNFYLMQLPWELVDYVLLHELTHTKIMAHGKPFWEEMARFLPGVMVLRKQIRQMQPRLLPI